MSFVLIETVLLLLRNKKNNLYIVSCQQNELLLILNCIYSGRKQYDLEHDFKVFFFVRHYT